MAHRLQPPRPSRARPRVRHAPPSHTPEFRVQRAEVVLLGGHRGPGGGSRNLVSILSLLLVVAISILVTRTAAVMLAHTGLARESARFQARSAFSGVGFTTSESEKVVNHPVRRRVVLGLMLLGNAGIVTAMSSLILTFVGGDLDRGSLVTRIVLLVSGLTGLWALAMSTWVDQRLSRTVDWALRRYTDLDVRDYASLMHLGGDYRLAELAVQEGDWITGRSLGELRLRDEGIVVLGVNRKDGHYLGAPIAETRVMHGDSLLLYGRGKTLEELDERERGEAGDRAHSASAREQDVLERKESRRDPGSDPPGR